MEAIWLVNILRHTHTHTSLSDRGRRKRVSPFALTFEYYQTEALSNHRLAVDSGMPIVQLSLATLIAALFACHSFFLLSFFNTALSLIFLPLLSFL